jgi:DNA modification methylase
MDMSDHRYKIIQGDCIKSLRALPEESIHTCVTSPPYFGLRDYGAGSEEIGQEDTVDAYVEKMVEVFREVRRVLRDDGTLWLNLGDSYMAQKGVSPPPQSIGGQRDMPKDFVPGNRKEQRGLKHKDLIGIPWRVAFALQADGWWLRQDIVWNKPNPMPESVQDRCTRAHEYIFMFSKKAHYYYDHEAIKEPAQNWGTRDRSEMRDGTTDPKLKHHGLKGKEWEENPMKNKRSVWTVNTKGYKGAHFAVYPKELITPCVRAGTSKGGCCSECGMPYQRNIVDPIANLEPVEAIERKGVMLTPEDSALVLWLEQNGGDYRISIAGEKHADNWQDVPFGNGRRSQLESKGYTLFHWGVNKKTDEWKPGCTCSLKKDGVQSTRCTVLDPFNGSATTGVVALNEDCHYIGLELNPEYIELSHKRIAEESPMTLMEMFK